MYKRQLLHDILFLAGHAGDAASAAALCLLGGLELTLDITGLGQGVDAPVSYTHLDVSKRQGRGSVLAAQTVAAAGQNDIVQASLTQGSGNIQVQGLAQRAGLLGACLLYTSRLPYNKNSLQKQTFSASFPFGGIL